MPTKDDVPHDNVDIYYEYHTSKYFQTNEGEAMEKLQHRKFWY